MSRNEFDMAHIDCPVANKTVIFRSSGSLLCPECKEIIKPREFIYNGAESLVVGEKK